MFKTNSLYLSNALVTSEPSFTKVVSLLRLDSYLRIVWIPPPPHTHTSLVTSNCTSIFASYAVVVLTLCLFAHQDPKL